MGTDSRTTFNATPLLSGKYVFNRKLTVAGKGTSKLVDQAACVPEEDQLLFSADVLILGAYDAPGGVPMREGFVGSSFGHLRKDLLSLGPHNAVPQPDSARPISAPKPVTTVPLHWKLTYGSFCCLSWQPARPRGLPAFSRDGGRTHHSSNARTVRGRFGTPPRLFVARISSRHCAKARNLARPARAVNAVLAMACTRERGEHGQCSGRQHSALRHGVGPRQPVRHCSPCGDAERAHADAPPAGDARVLGAIIAGRHA
jgi:hypothetical protein